VDHTLGVRARRDIRSGLTHTAIVTTLEEMSMSAMQEVAAKFFDACETGGGWEACREYCHPEATFSAQAGALAEIDTLESYTEWMKVCSFQSRTDPTS